MILLNGPRQTKLIYSFREFPRRQSDRERRLDPVGKDPHVLMVVSRIPLGPRFIPSHGNIIMP